MWIVCVVPFHLKKDVEGENLQSFFHPICHFHQTSASICTAVGNTEVTTRMEWKLQLYIIHRRPKAETFCVLNWASSKKREEDIWNLKHVYWAFPTKSVRDGVDVILLTQFHIINFAFVSWTIFFIFIFAIHFPLKTHHHQASLLAYLCCAHDAA